MISTPFYLPHSHSHFPDDERDGESEESDGVLALRMVMSEKREYAE